MCSSDLRLGFDYRFQRKDGRYRWLRSELRRRILPDGTFSRELIGFTTDIEESIQREAARRKMEIERMRTERTLETVSKIQQRMLHATSVAELYSEACQTLVKDGYYEWVVITEPKNSDEVCFSAVTHQAGRSGLATTQGQSDGQSATFDPASSWTDQTGQFFAGACGVSIPLQTGSEP